MTKEEAIELILDELRKAEKKHPGWPVNVVYRAAILCEEAGEVVKEALDVSFGVGSMEKLKVELAQTGAMAIRNLIHLDGEK